MHVVRGLKAVKEFKHVRVVELLHDLSLGHRVPNLILLDEKRLLHRLHGVLLACVELLDSKYFSKGAFSNQLNHFEVRKLHHLWCDRLGNITLFSVDVILVLIKFACPFLFLFIQPPIYGFSVLFRSLTHTL